MLHVRVTRQLDTALPGRERAERCAQRADTFGKIRCRVPQVEAQRRQDLVVPRPPEVQAPAGLADGLRQAGFERRVRVLVLERDLPLAAGETVRERLEALTDRGAVIVADQSLCREHLGMRDGATHVVRHEARIESVIFARRVAEYALVERQTLVPEAAHGLLPCSSGVSAAMSSTTSVPVPSLVKTSSRMLSGSL